MLRKRIITALIGGAGFLVVLYVGGPWIVLLAGVLAALAFGEWVRLKGVPFLSLPALLGWVALEGILLCTGGE
ncbi:MAG: phosphatidate cytidylyltransferase, partial [Alicyclobacillaceae bacterium]|nr:phosphatidate cytidylyltransferase [Alicyclobacillaceae bacterium]